MDAERRRKVVDSMRHAINRGTTLTRQLLAFSRRRPLAPKVVDLREQLLGMEEMLHRSLRGDIEVRMAFDDPPATVELDPGEFELAVLNICLNARDAMPGGGTIEICVRASPGALAPAHDDAVAVTFADAGVGMSPETLSHAFEPFFTTKEVGRGSGLGLAQVYGFIVQSNGQALLDSRPGKGTTVTLVFPRSRKPVTPAQEPEPVAGIAVAGRGERRSRLRGRVLLVEDDTSIAALTRQMLDNTGLEVTHVKSARSALDVLEGGAHFDILFSDVMMPGGMSGVDLARAVRDRWRALPVVLTTGYIEAARAAVAEGLEVLVKPYPLDQLVTTLRRRLSGRPAVARQPRSGA